MTFAFDESGRRYSALLGSEEVGHADVDPIGAGALLIKHTEVSPRFEGRGFAGRLMKHILDDARSRQRKVIPVCPYAAAYIRKHPEYQDLVRN